MTSEFFKHAPATFSGYDITNNQINSLERVIEGTISYDEVARDITKHVEAGSTPLEMLKRLDGLWTLLNETAVALLSAQSIIISVLKQIRTLPKVSVPPGEGEGIIDLDDGLIWKELTNWANNWADAFNSHSAQLLIEACRSEQERESRKQRYASACAYAARLSASEDETLSSYGVGLERTTRAIVDALEYDFDKEKRSESINAACQVFIYASHQLHSLCKEQKREGLLSGTSSDRLWHGDKGFSMERWEFWKKRLATLAREEDLLQDTRTDIACALQAAQKAET